MSGELPEGWTSCEVGKLAVLVTSGSRDWSKYYSAEGAYFVRSAEINDFNLRLTEAIRVALPSKVEGKRSLVERGNIFGVQFHPEKSGEVGLVILKNFWEA